MIKRKKYRSFFENKKCQICGKQGTMFRLIKNKHYMLCDGKKCDKITRVRAGFFDDSPFKK